MDARELGEFLRGLEEGIESRYRIQTRTYPRRVRRVPVYVQDLYQFVRERRGEPMVATSTRGRPLAEVGGRLRDLFGKGTVNVLIGSREGLPSGVLRLSDLVVDVVPGVTLATDLALTGCLMAILTHLLGDRRAFQKWARV